MNGYQWFGGGVAGFSSCFDLNDDECRELYRSFCGVGKSCNGDTLFHLKRGFRLETGKEPSMWNGGKKLLDGEEVTGRYCVMDDLVLFESDYRWIAKVKGVDFI